MTEKNMWNLSPQEALKACQASEQGLTTEQAEKIRLEKGENVLLEEKKKSAFQVFLDQFKETFSDAKPKFILICHIAVFFPCFLEMKKAPLLFLQSL